MPRCMHCGREIVDPRQPCPKRTAYSWYCWPERAEDDEHGAVDAGAGLRLRPGSRVAAPLLDVSEGVTDG